MVCVCACACVCVRACVCMCVRLWPGIEFATNKGLGVSDVCLDERQCLLELALSCFNIPSSEPTWWRLGGRCLSGTSGVVLSNLLYCTHVAAHFCRCIVGMYCASRGAHTRPEGIPTSRPPTVTQQIHVWVTNHPCQIHCHQGGFTQHPSVRVMTSHHPPPFLLPTLLILTCFPQGEF